MTIPLPILSLLPWGLTAGEQTALTGLALAYGTPVSMRHVGTDGWVSMPVRRPVDHSLNPFAHRMTPGIEWDWTDSPATELAREIVSRVGSLFRMMTRVTLLIQSKGSSISLHRDPVFGTDYGAGPYKTSPVHQDHFGNRFLSIKAPLTEKKGDNGCPVIKLDDGGEWRYDAGTRFFAINEVEAMHGARACAHHRGVLWIDGWLDDEVLSVTQREQMPVTALEGSTPELSEFSKPLHAPTSI